MIYRRRFDPEGRDSLAKLARWIRPGSRVLELGAAAGYFTAWLSSQGCRVDIVEHDPDAAREASAHAERTVVADLDHEQSLRELGDARYDTIVCADVLEHLRDGPRLLARLRERLADGGELVLSVPNVAHSAVIAGLVDERFPYGGEGLLDSTHLRLYTWRTLAEALTTAGFAVREWDATEVELFDTEFRARSDALPAALRDALVERPHACVYQWLVRAVPDVVASQPEPPAIATGQHVPVRLLYAATPDGLTLDRVAVAMLPIGVPATRYEWRWPVPSPALRLLLADRIGVVRVHELQLHAADELLWSSGEHDDPFDVSPSAVPLGEGAFALVAEDAWIAPLAPPALALRADRMTATLAWPASIAETAEFGVLAALADAMRTRSERAQHARDALAARLDDAERQRDDERAAHAATRTALGEAREALSRRNTDVAELERAVDAYRAENARLDAALAAQERIIGYRQSFRWWLRLPFVRVKLWLHRLAIR